MPAEGPPLVWLVALVGRYVLVSPFVSASVGIGGLVFIVLPAVVINRYINRQQGAPG